MSEAVGFFDGFAEGMMDGLRVAMQAEILKFDHVAMKADIQPLQGDLPPILDVPVSLHRAGAFLFVCHLKKGIRSLLFLMITLWMMQGNADTIWMMP